MAFFFVCQWSSVNDEHRVIFIEYEDDLQQTTASAGTPHEPFVVIPVKRVRPRSAPNHDFGFVWVHSMLGNVFDIPRIPSEIDKAILYLII